MAFVVTWHLTEGTHMGGSEAWTVLGHAIKVDIRIGTQAGWNAPSPIRKDACKPDMDGLIGRDAGSLDAARLLDAMRDCCDTDGIAVMWPLRIDTARRVQLRLPVPPPCRAGGARDGFFSRDGRRNIW